MAKPRSNNRALRPQSVAIVGVSGAVGQEMVHCLERSSVPVEILKPFASERSAGQQIRFRDQSLSISALNKASFEGVDLVLSATSSDLAKSFVPDALSAGARVIDNSSAFRMNDDVPLIVPEINSHLLTGNETCIANPNCVAAIITMAVWPLFELGEMKRFIASTYQAASGAGAAAIDELVDGTRAQLSDEPFTPKVLKHPYAFNIFSHDSDVDVQSGYNDEEMKVVAETRKILERPNLGIGITCIRVPVLRAHCMSLTIEFEESVSTDEAQAVLSNAPGIQVIDDRVNNHFPMPVEGTGCTDILVGRIRQDLSDPSGRSLCLFVCGDQLLKGAAYNAVQIAEILIV